MYHNHPVRGPERCGADPDNPRATGCPFGGPHYETEAAAEEAFQKELTEKHGGVSTVSIDPQIESLKERISSLPTSPTVEEVTEVGKEFNNIVKVRLGFDPDELDYNNETWNDLINIGVENRRLLGEFFETGEYSNKIRGNRKHKHHLEKALENIPNNVLARVKGDFNLKIERKDTSYGGTYSSGAEVMLPARPENSYRSLPENVSTGDYYYDHYLDHTEYEGFSVTKVVRGVGEPLTDEESVKEFANKDELIDMLKNGLIDIDYKIKLGKAAEFEKKYPKIAEQIKQGVMLEKYYVGKKPSGTRSSLRKVGDKVTAKDMSGVEHEISKPLHRRYDKSIDYDQHTITAVKGGGESTLLHEYCHAIQSSYSYKAPIPTEREVFQKFSEGELINTGEYEYYRGGPDEYMFEKSGRELFPRATEGFYYPVGNDYLYGRDSLENNGKKIRDWVAGVWLSLGRSES